MAELLTGQACLLLVYDMLLWMCVCTNHPAATRQGFFVIIYAAAVTAEIWLSVKKKKR